MKKLQFNTIAYALLLTCNIALVWLLPYFPTQDGPSHLYNLVVLRDLLNGGKDWGSIYTYELRATPNLGFHLIGYPLLYFFTPRVVEKIFISFFLLLMGFAIPVFLRTFSGRVFPFAYLVFPVMFNFCLMMGFYSYVITVPLFILALSASWKTRDWPRVQRFLLYNLVGIVLFYFHLIPSVLYVMGLAFMALVRPASIRNRFFNALEFLAMIAPWLTVFGVYIFRSHHAVVRKIPITHIPGIDLTRDFFSFSTVIFDRRQQSAAAILLFLILFFLSVYMFDNAKMMLRKPYGKRETPHGEKFISCFVFSLVLIYFLVPFNFAGGSFFNERLPWLIFLFLLPLLRCPEMLPISRLCSLIIASSAVLYLFLNFTVLHQQSAVVSEFLRGSSADIGKGAFLMLYRDPDSGWSRSDVLMHAAAYYGVEKKAVDLGNYEVAYDYFPIKYKRGIPPVPDSDRVEYEPETIRWEKYPNIEYLLAWKAGVKEGGEIGRFYHVAWQDENMAIWQRNR